ncbi:MAG: D-3-phosphoglycerate dehydrogenase/C-terminal binding protein [Lacunisphaera sp.]|nr:D-3-phosphoglycerate dehydrogenase/C-terminal binding protein [Lacunisphaera sp.]
MPLPVVVILCPKEFTFSDPAATIERSVLDGVAEVQTIAMDFNEPLPSPALAADALLLWHNIPVGAEVIARLTKCRALIRNGVGYDSVDTKAAAARGIAVCNVPDYGTEEVADHALALALALSRQLFPLDAEAKRLGWKIKVADKMRRLRDRVFGVVGLGAIGTATALRAKAFGFRVRFYDPYLPRGARKALGIERAESLDGLLAVADVLSIHCPLTAETRGLIGAHELALMKPTSFLVNTARGDIVQKAPLFAALREGRLAGAGLDVVEDEPLRTAEEAATPNLIVTCHAAFCSPEGMVEMRTTSARIARAAVLGEPVWNRVN